MTKITDEERRGRKNEVAVAARADRLALARRRLAEGLTPVEVEARGLCCAQTARRILREIEAERAGR